MTPTEKTREHKVIMDTRLGELCGTNTPTRAQIDQARREADEWVERCEYRDWVEGGE